MSRAASLPVKVLLVAMVLAGCSGPGPGRQAAEGSGTFYLSAVGDDSADGTAPGRAWRTLQRASRQRLAPGARLLLRAGDTFTGTLVLDGQDGGDPARPVTVGSTGRATIRSAGAAVSITDTDGVILQDLRLNGDARARPAASGVSVHSTDGPHLGVTLQRLDVAGFRYGISVGGTATAGWSGVRVSASRLHDNRDAGLLSYGPAFQPAAPGYALHDLTVEDVEADHNPGNPDDRTHNSGSGIVLGSVSGGWVTGSRAHDNGSACAAEEGPVGIWAYDSAGVVIEDNDSWDNRSAGADGGGFDLDQNVSGSVLRGNRSHGNTGPGLMLYSAVPGRSQHGNLVTGNLSENDAAGPRGYGGLSVLGEVRDARIEANAVRGPALALKLAGTLPGVLVRDNDFQVTGAGPAAILDGSVKARLSGNRYRTGGGPAVIQAGTEVDSEGR